MIYKTENKLSFGDKSLSVETCLHPDKTLAISMFFYKENSSVLIQVKPEELFALRALFHQTANQVQRILDNNRYEDIALSSA